MDWNQLNVGRKLTLAAACAAAGSMVLNWVQMGILSESGFGQGAVLFLVFWVYPVLAVVKSKPLNPPVSA
jgi:hypothetical protein